MREAGVDPEEIVRSAESRDLVSSLCCYLPHYLQVKYQRTTNSTSGTAVQIDADSTYEAEFTSFSGFDGEVRKLAWYFP